jgi:hypothetical protein
MHFFRTLALVAALLVCIVPVVAAPVAAQNGTTTPTAEFAGDLDDDCEAPEAIDEKTVVCSASLDGTEAVVVLRSDELQQVTVTDAGAFMTGGEINRRTFTLREGERNTIRFDVTVHNGFAGVSIDTGETLYAVPIEEESTLIGEPWSAQDVQLAAVSGAAGVATVAVFVVIRTVLGRTDEPERVA